MIPDSRWQRFKDKSADIFWGSFEAVTDAFRAIGDGILWLVLLEWLD